MKKVDICESNFALGTDKVVEELEKSQEFEVEVHGCLGHCGECCETLFVLLDGEMISADSPEKLLDEINNNK
ncbi:hypothetical protein SFBM_0560 [Candidatus Arthromitus sp. SFB-mouse-Japan]|uniref:DUF1450 domain-containing protein n=1 Tax=unclassified Candidatus Neoarthromitus TaxID=2638829 RepID=UPI00021B7F91|nr:MULTISPECIES: DUF1450 domain-containing protein [unclassified Candidatus Arthromitus]EIA24487.1 hypothetical protein SFB2_080G2 [Candidatus Arthromitus sp. SFB-2]EIA24549.1 hypothetical protein SFB3_189G3 [Candidatus Arthromitus sp. SFB-3]EIA29239.1 hypothetical protein SFB6_011G16 [Candidatus Arthromitus sp. SFB-co]EIA29584.1 hypothetical protein SFB4_057G23 [Candidatus Arthromitus sp. SFB-4]EIA30610.1 hypothetical protein SFBSU_006G291 [Candidatus Arthromitus sp. SFB-mouse-SU]